MPRIEWSEEEKALAGRLENIAKVIAGALGGKAGFMLVTFGEYGTHYVSNCAREDIEKAMNELFDNWKKQESDPPLANRT